MQIDFVLVYARFCRLIQKTEYVIFIMKIVNLNDFKAVKKEKLHHFSCVTLKCWIFHQVYQNRVDHLNQKILTHFFKKKL